MSPGTVAAARGVTPESEVRMPADRSPSKTCSRCGEPHDRNDTYCKDCRRQYAREWDAQNADKRRGYTRQAKERHPERTRARQVVTRAIRAGRLTRPDACDRCGKGGTIEAHHADYSKPLEVEWLCKDCHAAAKAEPVVTPSPLADRIIAALGPEWRSTAEVAAELGVHPIAVGRLFASQLEPRGVEREWLTADRQHGSRLRIPPTEASPHQDPSRKLVTE